MSFKSTLSADQKELVMEIGGRFDFNLHHQFRRAYHGLPATTRFVVDLRNTTYMDSSAMGMLLLLREYAGKENAKIRLINCSPEIKKVLAVSNMDKLFPLE
jgi:anti-anti-sigma factor